MADSGLNYNLRSIIQTVSNVAKSEIIVPARVVDVILDSSHPEFEEFGHFAAIGAIKYAIIGKNLKEDNPKSLPIAFPLQSHIKHIPLRNEVVLIISSPSELLDQSSNIVKNYYLDIVNLWNHPHHNATPSGSNGDINLGDDFKELADINPMHPFEGDIIVEGRQGQSLRFSSGIPNKTPWIGQQGKPITIISNGQISTEDGFTTITENINEDFSSIYLTSDQQIKLTPAQTFNLFSPTAVDIYSSSQFITNSDRIVLNGRDSILNTAANQIGLKATGIFIEGTSSVSINATKIQLGENNTQPILKGDDTVKLLKDLLTELRSLGTVLTRSATPQTVVNLLDAGTSLIERATSLQTKLPGLKSTKTYSE